MIRFSQSTKTWTVGNKNEIFKICLSSDCVTMSDLDRKTYLDFNLASKIVTVNSVSFEFDKNIWKIGNREINSEFWNERSSQENLTLGFRHILLCDVSLQNLYEISLTDDLETTSNFCSTNSEIINQMDQFEVKLKHEQFSIIFKKILKHFEY